ncbi:hypothetical protein [Achromobacter phage ewik_TL4]|nr:hypothetical protein [Achromobacter phage hasilly_LB3]WNO48774.1 hypothetical protein [Achromobacter phage nyaak_TL1]WNO48902.1 hypothetical protein [Achromobacter phage kuwaak_TL2]WNO48967.1 hypothetical protein [Achromobacter phage ewii_LB8]WNO49251.1 hypothetical protein [Achromobacter phage ewik_TL4]WOZ53376.1 hypothetical protein [Achromobacter phage tuull]
MNHVTINVWLHLAQCVTKRLVTRTFGYKLLLYPPDKPLDMYIFGLS